MKIITLLPVKNESWILRFSLKNFSLFSDAIIILDDGSTDNLHEIIKEFPKVISIPFSQKEELVDMSLRRSILLKAGRKEGGTHFIFLDADETLSEDFALSIRKYLEPMKIGETLTLPWILISKKEESFIFESKQKTNYKDFIFCDDMTSMFQKQLLSEARTPGDVAKRTPIPFESGYVLHFQNIAPKRNQYKQAWYRCNELLEGKKSPRKINLTYAFTKDLTPKNEEVVTDFFTTTNASLIDTEASYSFYIETIQEMFTKKRVVFFECLDIWHLKELHDYFVVEMHREPKPKVFPEWLIAINTVKNKIRTLWYH